MSYSNGLLPSDNDYYHESGSSGIVGKDGRDGRDGIGFKLTDDGDYDIQKKIVNVAEGIENSNAITRHQLDTGLASKVNQNLIPSLPQNFNTGQIPIYDSQKHIFVGGLDIEDKYNDTVKIQFKDQDFNSMPLYFIYVLLPPSFL